MKNLSHSTIIETFEVSFLCDCPEQGAPWVCGGNSTTEEAGQSLFGVRSRAVEEVSWRFRAGIAPDPKQANCNSKLGRKSEVLIFDAEAEPCRKLRLKCQPDAPKPESPKLPNSSPSSKLC